MGKVDPFSTLIALLGQILEQRPHLIHSLLRTLIPDLNFCVLLISETFRVTGFLKRHLNPIDRASNMSIINIFRSNFLNIWNTMLKARYSNFNIFIANEDDLNLVSRGLYVVEIGLVFLS